MMDIVDQTLRLWRQSVFDFGSTDCLLSIGAYIDGLKGTRVAERFRGTYASEDEAKALVAAYGGPEGLIDLCGLPRINPGAAGRGDVVVLNTGQEREGSVGALCTGLGIAARLERGVIEVDRRFVVLTHAWKIS